MRIANWLAAGVTAIALVACGGGGGDKGTSPFGSGSGSTGGGTGSGNGGSTATTATLTLTLQDSSGTALGTPSLTGTQNAVAVASLLNAAGAPVPNTLVTFTTTGLALTPASGQTITDSTGIARVQIRPTDPFASGAATLTAAASADGDALSANVAIGLGAATASLSPITVSATTVPAYQAIQVSVPATLSTGGPATQFPVTFSSSCGTFDPATASTDSNGIARSAYRNQAGTNTACSGNQTLTATAGSSSVTTTVTAQAPVAANLVFVSSTPSRIYLVGTPGVSQSLVSFKLVDSSGNPVQGQNVTMTLTLKPPGTYLGAVLGTTSLQQATSADGTVSVSVNAGAQPGPVQIQAMLDTNTAITNVSNSLSVASGLPAQKAFSLSLSTFNIEALDRDGVSTDVTLRIADRLGNPVPDGTIVNFIAEGGQIVASCPTTGAATNNASACTVQLTSQAPRPSDGRVTLLAWAQGEETFTDTGTPTNNIYDKTPTAEPFEDLGQPFLDKNENGVYDVGTDVTVGTAPGSAACPPGHYSVPSTCDGDWGSALVRQSAVVVFSGSDPFLHDTSLTTASSRCTFSFRISDVNDNPMPAGAPLDVSSVSGGGTIAAPDAVFEGFGGAGGSIPNTAAKGGTTHTAVFSNCVNTGTLTFKLTLTTPRKTTTFFIP